VNFSSAAWNGANGQNLFSVLPVTASVQAPNGATLTKSVAELKFTVAASAGSGAKKANRSAVTKTAGVRIFIRVLQIQKIEQPIPTSLGLKTLAETSPLWPAILALPW
jgi:hypothetical protein